MRKVRRCLLDRDFSTFCSYKWLAVQRETGKQGDSWLGLDSLPSVPPLPRMGADCTIKASQSWKGSLTATWSECFENSREVAGEHPGEAVLAGSE